MRVAGWAFVMCTVLGAIGAFLPSIELRLGGSAVSKRTQLSLHAASSDRELVRRLLVAYRGSAPRRVGAELVRTVSPRASGRTRAALDDARDAMDTLDEVGDDDVRTAGMVFAITLWTLLGLQAAMAGLVFTELMRDGYRQSCLVAALVLSVVVAATAIALHLGCREVVWQANDEVGRTAVALRVGAYVLPVAAIGSLIAAIVLVVQRGRAARARA